MNKKPKNKLQLNELDAPFFILVLILVCFGLIMLYSASYAVGYYRMQNSAYYIKDQLIFAVVGVAVMFFISRFDYHLLRKFAVPVMGVTLVLLVVVLFMEEINKAKRWIIIPGLLTFQPSEIAKFAVILLFAHWISLNQSKMKTFKYGVLPYALLLCVIAGLLLLEPHLSGTVLILMIGGLLMFVGGTGIVWFIAAGTAAGAVVFGAVLFVDGLVPYAMSRIAMWQDPFSQTQDKGYQTIQSILAIGSGGLFGLGIGNSRQKHLYLPEPQNDFIFSVICEELGFVGALLVMLLFLFLLIRGLQIAIKARDKFGALLVIGIMVQVTSQALLNIAVVTNTIPNTGISLPFFSAGGTSLLMLLFEMGVVLSVSRQSKIIKN